MSDIFISYKKEEKEVAAKLAHALEKDGWTVWWDVDIPTGADFETLIKETLGTCDVTIVLWSKESVQSDWVRAEAEYARKYKKVFPVLIEDVPHQDLPLLFQKLHIHDLTDWSGERDTPGYKHLYRDLVTLLGEPKSPEVRALEERLEEAHHELEKQKQDTQGARRELEQQKQDTQKARQELEEQIQQRSSEAAKFKDELNEAQHELEKQKQELQQRPPSTFGKILPWVVTASIVVLGGLYLAVRAPSSGTQELQAEVSKWQAQAEDATKRVSELDRVNRELTATIDPTEGYVSQLEDTVVKWQARAEQAEGQNQKDRETIEALEKELEQLHEHIKRASEVGSDMIGIPAVESDQFSRFEWKDIQKALNDIGFDAGESDGIPGFKTRSAIKLFQESRGFPIGKLTLGQRERLFSDAKEAAYGRLGAVPTDVLQSDMIEIPAGCFEMGGEEDDDEKPIHRVCVGRFAIGKYEVTFDQYDRFAEAAGRWHPEDMGWGRGSRPVINVTWDDAVAHAEWLSSETDMRYRLPTEAEWEYAARAQTTTNYWWEDNVGGNRANCMSCGSQWDNKQTAPVGSFDPNQFSLHDTAGNVWEWVQDCYRENYKGAPDDGSVWAESNCNERVIRGGSWNDKPETLRSASRYGNPPDDRSDYIGFRLAQEIE